MNASMNNFIYVSTFYNQCFTSTSVQKRKITQIAGTEQREDINSPKANTHKKHAATSDHIEQQGL